MKAERIIFLLSVLASTAGFGFVAGGFITMTRDTTLPDSFRWLVAALSLAAWAFVVLYASYYVKKGYAEVIWQHYLQLEAKRKARKETDNTRIVA